MYLSIQRLRPDAQLPRRATADSAGYDLYALPDVSVTIQPGDICKIPTGIAVAPSRPDVALCIFPRSGLSTKHGITLANSVGLVDSDYRGELLVPLINHGKEPFTVEQGMRIAQLVVLPILTPELHEVSELNETTRGASGFGASGLS
ncbi:dUTP diphosphatase [Ruminococcus sp.]|uniref:dUTP diphosphatase n=1 Tax=Ruminococcus sp. TaxID=41978 RepID=UPI0025D758A4|nr:dUTP diphosphatase [Ruminococcus sp.]